MTGERLAFARSSEDCGWRHMGGPGKANLEQPTTVPGTRDPRPRVWLPLLIPQPTRDPVAAFSAASG
jgi:hypothetical protein